MKFEDLESSVGSDIREEDLVGMRDDYLRKVEDELKQEDYVGAGNRYNWLGMISLQLGDLESAGEYFDKAGEVLSKQIDVYTDKSSVVREEIVRRILD